MTVNRRSFLGTMTACASFLPLTGLPRLGFMSGRFGGPQFESPYCALVDCGESCQLPESLAGYECGLKAIEANYARVATESIPFYPLVIVPGFAGDETANARKIRDLAYRGSTVLIESGALFDDPAQGEAHRGMLRSHFSIHTAAPISLWDHREEGPAAKLAAKKLLNSMESIAAPMSSLPYVDFVWPHVTKIRDFSRVLPVTGEKGEVVAVSPGGIPVAIRRRIGQGAVVFLGSPVGPSLLSGDPEAREWLHGIVVQAV